MSFPAFVTILDVAVLIPVSQCALFLEIPGRLCLLWAMPRTSAPNCESLWGELKAYPHAILGGCSLIFPFYAWCVQDPPSWKMRTQLLFFPSPTPTHVRTHANFPSCLPSIFLKNNTECRLYCVCFILFTFEPPTEFSLNVNPEEHERWRATFCELWRCGWKSSAHWTLVVTQVRQTEPRLLQSLHSPSWLLCPGAALWWSHYKWQLPIGSHYCFPTQGHS